MAYMNFFEKRYFSKNLTFLYFQDQLHVLGEFTSPDVGSNRPLIADLEPRKRAYALCIQHTEYERFLLRSQYTSVLIGVSISLFL